MSDKDPMIELIRHVRDVCAEAVAGNRYDPFEDDTCDASDDVRELDPSRILARAKVLQAHANRGSAAPESPTRASRRPKTDNHDSDEGWRMLDEMCKTSTQFHARDIALPLLAAEHDPYGEADCDPYGAADLLANILGSSGDANSRAAAFAVLQALDMQGFSVAPTNQVREDAPIEPSHDLEATRDPELEGGAEGDPAPVGLTNASTSFPYFEGWFPNFLEQSPLGPTLLSLEKDEETWFAVYHTIKAAWLHTPGFIDDPDDCLAGIDPARVESLDFEPCGHCKACEAGAAEVEAAGVVSVERVPAGQVDADAPCAHPRTYYNTDTDNFYCVDCRKGMGLIYYAANITQVKESIAARKMFYGTFERQNAHCDGSGQLSGYAGNCAGCIACNHSICRTALEAAYKEIARGQTATRLPRIAGQPEHQKDTGWAADPFAQLERLADYCNAVDMVDEDSNDVPIVDAVIGVLKDHQRLLVSLSDPRGDNEAVSYDELCDELARCLQDLSAIADGDHDNGDQRCWKAYDRALKVWDQATGTSPDDPATPDPTVVDEGQDHE